MIKEALGIILAFIFLLQTFGIVNVIPLEAGFLITGLNPNLALAGFTIALAIIVGFSIVVYEVVLFTLGMSLERIRSLFGKIYLELGVIIGSFLATLFFYMVLIGVNLVPTLDKDIIPYQNFYLFWFMVLFTYFNFMRKPKVKKGVATTERAQLDNVRWLRHILGKDKIKSMTGPKGDLIYQEPRSAKLKFFLTIFLLLAYSVPPLIILIVMSFFGGPLLLWAFVSIIVGLVFLLLGLTLGRRVKIYSRAISIPLPVIGDLPIFTIFLPKSLVNIPIEEIKSYKISHTEYSRNNDRTLLEIITKGGDRIATSLNIVDKKGFERAFDLVISGKVKNAKLTDFY